MVQYKCYPLSASSNPVIDQRADIFNPQYHYIIHLKTVITLKLQLAFIRKYENSIITRCGIKKIEFYLMLGSFEKWQTKSNILEIKISFFSIYI
jgi:hypothetical protein